VNDKIKKGVINMLKQLGLNFNLGITKDKITPRSGLAIYAEVLKKLNIDSLINKHMPYPGSNRGYNPSSYIIPLMLMLYGGGRHIEDLREIINDNALAELLNIKIPSVSTFGDWLRRYGKIGLNGFKKIIDETNKLALSLDDNTEYTLFIDPTMIEANKQDAVMTYMGFKGYRPIIATLNELPVIIFHEFKDGNKTGADATVLKEIFNLIPKGKRIKHVSIDSEFYANEAIEFLISKNVTFTISADKTKSLKDTIKSIKDWSEFKTEGDIATDRQIGENIYCMEKGDPFRIVVLRWLSEPDLFEEDHYNYHVIATNLECPKEKVVYEYNKRVGIENIIKELKIGIGLENIPTGDYFANSLFFAVGVLVYNTFIIMKTHLLPEEYRTKTIDTVRWSIINIAGKLVNHGRRFYLLLACAKDKLLLYRRMREGCVVFA
jgi:hypothetical protein